MKHLFPGLFLFCCSALFSQAPKVENVRFEQRTDGSLLVDIYYDLNAFGGILPDISIEASDDNGETWDFVCESLTGDFGKGIIPGEGKEIVWDFYADHPDQKGDNYRFRITANQEICGKLITEDFTLTEDLDCSKVKGHAIRIGASDVTLDLGGHTIFGARPYDGSCGIQAEFVDRITIRNGIIENGYIFGIDLSNSDSSLVEDMIVRDLISFNPDTFVIGVVVGKSDGVIIRDCEFELRNEFHKQAVGIVGASVAVDNIDVISAAVGIGLGGNGDGVVTVENSRFNVYYSGVLVDRVSNARIANNIFESGGGVYVEPYLADVISGLVIEENEMLNGAAECGIYLRGGTFVTARNNTIRNFGKGIFLDRSIECNDDGEENEHCIYATGNIIENNVVLGNDFDLEHCDLCTGNTWTGNTYESAFGLEIYQYGPSTARAGLADIDSVAGSVLPDAELMEVFGGSVDTTGRTYNWIYYCRSPGQQKAYKLLYQDGRALLRDSLDYTMFEHDMPIPDTWIDSDSAIAITDEMGGRDFRNEFDLETIEMGLGYSHNLVWSVCFIAADTAFCVQSDAGTLK